MSSVTQRVNSIKQPWGGYIRASQFNKQLLDDGNELCPQKWTFGHTKTDTYRFKEQFHRFETVMPETRYVDDVSH